MEISGGTFLVTGGGTGVGAACARMLAEAGASVVLADINEDEGARTAAAIGPRARFVPMDIADASSVEAAVQTAAEAFGGLHGCVNCAGAAIFERMLSRNGPHPLGSFTQMVQINLIGAFNVMRLSAAVMAQNVGDSSGERGVLINAGHIAAFDGQTGQAAIAASTGGLASMTLPLARDLARYGIRVVTLALGMFETPVLQLIPEEQLRQIKQQMVFPARAGKPEEVAVMVRQVIENPMVNGAVLRLDGGIRLPAGS